MLYYSYLEEKKMHCTNLIVLSRYTKKLWYARPAQVLQEIKRKLAWKYPWNFYEQIHYDVNSWKFMLKMTDHVLCNSICLLQTIFYRPLCTLLIQTACQYLKEISIGEDNRKAKRQKLLTQALCREQIFCMNGALVAKQKWQNKVSGSILRFSLTLNIMWH